MTSLIPRLAKIALPSVGVDVLGDPKKPTKQTDRRGRRSLQGFVILPWLLSLGSFVLRRGRRSRRPEKPTKQTDRRGRRSLQGFSKNPTVCFFWFLFFSRRGRRLWRLEKINKTNGPPRTSVPTENNHARSRSYSGNARNRTAPFYGGLLLRAKSSHKPFVRSVGAFCYVVFSVRNRGISPPFLLAFTVFRTSGRPRRRVRGQYIPSR